MEAGPGCRRPQCQLSVSRTPQDRHHLCTLLLRRELTLLRLMRDRQSVPALVTRLRLLLRTGIISHGRVSVLHCYYIEIIY